MRIKEITSPSNELFKVFDSLLHSRGIKKEKLALVSGRKIIPEILKSHPCENMIFSERTREDAFDLADQFQVSKGVEVSAELFEHLDDSGTHFPLLVVKTPQLENHVPSQTKGLSVFLALSDPSNLGASLRSLRAFDVSEVVLLKECAHPFLPKVTKAASGLNLSLNLKLGPSIHELDLEFPIGLDMNGSSLKDFQWPDRAQLVLGEEGQGLPDHLRDHAQLVKIEMRSDVESLSAPIAISIASYDFYIKKLK